MRQTTNTPAVVTAEHLPPEWISAYYDGELRGEPLRLAESHLTTCPLCQSELQNLRQLSDLLGSVPAPQVKTSPARFVSQVMLRLPRTPQPSWQASWLKDLWRVAPVGLFASWAFVQAALLVTGVIAWLFDDFFTGRPSVTFASPAALSDLLSAFQSLPDVTGLFAPVAQIFWINLLFTVLVAVLFWAWLASWWAAKKNQGA